MFNMKREKIKKYIFLVLYIIFVVLTLIGAFMVITNKVNNAGYAVIPMLFGLIFAMFYRNSKNAIKENTK